MSKKSNFAPAPEPKAGAKPVWVRALALLAAFELVGLLLYLPALDAPMFSDDSIYSVGNPWIAALVYEYADQWIDKYNAYESLNQFQLFSLGRAYEIRRDRSKARHAFQRGLAEGGVYDEMLRRKLRALGY